LNGIGFIPAEFSFSEMKKTHRLFIGLSWAAWQNNPGNNPAAVGRDCFLRLIFRKAKIPSCREQPLFSSPGRSALATEKMR
jgi:hypothetical protein